MSGIAPGPDPSMEDILASIRRILDADATPAAAPSRAVPEPPSAPVAVPAPEDDELLLDASMLVEEPAPEPVPAVIEAVPAPALPATLDAPLFPTKVPAMTVPTPEPDTAPPAPNPSLLGTAAADVTASSMMNLVRAVAVDRSAGVYRGGPTIEDLVREEIRPLLKDWLDTNLPPLVERLVRIEIERVVNRVAP